MIITKVKAVFFLVLTLPLAAQDRIIPLLISEHHADHMEFFFRHNVNASAVMIVLDAHADTVVNENYGLIKELVSEDNLSGADKLAGNHNWIHPLQPAPLERLIWISKIHGYPRSDKLEGFNRTISGWNSNIHAGYLSLEELRFTEISGETLFVSVDLDFFYSENYGARDVPSVLDALFSFSLRWQGGVVWAICLSRPWLPDDDSAWLFLEKSLDWLHTRTEFNTPEISLFNRHREDTSRTAQAILSEGREVPALREEDTPEHIKIKINRLFSQ
ncbi:MAG: hypothetical protein LBU66_03975 [Treponema sp.]|nr:hypothetical protein [Treponema sp.]